ncbi:MAG: ATP-binding cassette domain-containing protein [Methanothrix sp.]|uniref:energy-coupling factor ABC transporter ATP-binding protein n=1 Tax=Methanothrix sp. TaxID=90426 RepID=UPI003BB1D31F
MMNREMAIEVEDLSYTYSDGTRALDKVSFSLAEGQSLALLGPNGAGKSTLLLHLNGLLRGQGKVKIRDREISDESLRWVRSQVGMVFQDPDDQLFMPRLDEDVAFGPANMGLTQEEVDERVKWALQRVGLSDLSAKVPHRLSFGQRKRAAFATVLSMRPPVLVLDEPTSNLDPRSRMEMVSLIREQQRKGTAIITATHDVNLVPLLADRILLLNKSIVAEGDIHQIMNRRDLMNDLSLEMPILADLFKTLQEESLYSGAIPFRKDEAVEAIREML